MDKETRNAIERATQRARKLLEDDFTSQLEGDFDVHLDGTVSVKPSRHLSARQAFQRDRIIASIEHKRAAGMSAADSVRDYLRDSAFTNLNRFVALKMLEARELVQECITKGEESIGYCEFCGMAPGLPLLPDSAGYRLYIESIFDELSTEVKVLFDRRDPSSVIWPKRVTFDQLLQLLNTEELTGVWGEDETLGWVYQYFNGQDERRKMREESQAPRNNRELAIRNQFFTPRYVVQFLTDNTLGRIWYEMCGGSTMLADRCEYMVRQPGEISAPRDKKDPREIRVLDPACGSGHFLLYAFDLLLSIYEEAYADLESPESEITGNKLAKDYPDITALRQAIPGLIIGHNLHGIDIDPRCTQIAQLALWMRAQRAFRDYDISRAERPPIRRSNIVVAEPLVADKTVLKEFVSKLGDAELSRVFEGLVESLNLAGELGLLLRIEQIIGQRVKQGCTRDLFALPEERVRAALLRFVNDETSRAISRRRLFADDAVQGLAFIDIARNRYDVIVMNPPFGSSPERAGSYLKNNFPISYYDVYAAFVERMVEILNPGGLVGCLSSKTFFATSRLYGFRRWLLGVGGLRYCADFGQGVLDNAAVETAAYILSPATPSALVEFYNVQTKSRASDLLKCTAAKSHQRHSIAKQAIANFPNCSFATYWGSESLLSIFERFKTLDPEYAETAAGQMTGDDFRFVRTRWEPRFKVEAKWQVFAKGGEFFRYYCDWPLVIDWSASALIEYRKQTVRSVLLSRRAGAFENLPALVWNRVNVGFNVRALPSGAKFSDKAPAVFPKRDTWLLLGILCSRLAGRLCALQNPNRMFEVRDVSALPIPPVREEGMQDAVREIVAIKQAWSSRCEPSSTYTFFGHGIKKAGQSFSDFVVDAQKRAVDDQKRIIELQRVVDVAVEAAADLSLADQQLLTEVLGDGPIEAIVPRFATEIASGDLKYWQDLDLSYAVGCAFGRWDIRYALGQNTLPALPDPFAPIPVSPPGMLQGANGLCRRGEDFRRLMFEGEYPLSITGDGILVDDPGHPLDIEDRVRAVRMLLWGGKGDEQERAIFDAIGIPDLRQWLRISTGFFAAHVKRYSSSRRCAPIFWQLTTPSAGYSVWLYIQSFTSDTLFRVQNDFVTPKLAHEERRLQSLAQKLREEETSSQRKEFSAQEVFVDELRAFLEEVKRVAPLWNPNLDDGVIINFAPLWRLVPHHKAWQKELKATWDALCEGKYDWAHLAMHLWPERVVPKCADDRSLAIAHGLEDIFWIEGGDGKWTPLKSPTRTIDELVRERTSPAVKAALKSLIEAPVVSGSTGRKARNRKAFAVTEGGYV